MDYFPLFLSFSKTYKISAPKYVIFKKPNNKIKQDNGKSLIGAWWSLNSTKPHFPYATYIFVRGYSINSSLFIYENISLLQANKLNWEKAQIKK